MNKFFVYLRFYVELLVFLRARNSLESVEFWSVGNCTQAIDTALYFLSVKVDISSMSSDRENLKQCIQNKPHSPLLFVNFNIDIRIQEPRSGPAMLTGELFIF